MLVCNALHLPHSRFTYFHKSTDVKNKQNVLIWAYVLGKKGDCVSAHFTDCSHTVKWSFFAFKTASIKPATRLQVFTPRRIVDHLITSNRDLQSTSQPSQAKIVCSSAPCAPTSYTQSGRILHLSHIVQGPARLPVTSQQLSHVAVCGLTSNAK